MADIHEQPESCRKRVLVLRHLPNAGNHPPIYRKEMVDEAVRHMHEMMEKHGIAIVPPGYDYSVEEVDIFRNGDSKDGKEEENH